MDAMNGETLLPEAMIQHIQSFMSGKEAARSTLLSKSWYNAWLTRPTIDLDDRDFDYRYQLFEEFAKKTMQRYQDLNLKIESFRLRSYGLERRDAHDLIANAIKIGATDLRIDFFSFTPLPQEVLECKTLVTLCASGGRVNEDTVISCSCLKSLRLDSVAIPSNVFKAIITCCISMEELSLTHCNGLALSLKDLTKSFSDFASRFPCLKDLTILYCDFDGYTRLQIASTSLRTITFGPVSESQDDANFEVPNTLVTYA